MYFIFISTKDTYRTRSAFYRPGIFWNKFHLTSNNLIQKFHLQTWLNHFLNEYSTNHL